MGTIQRYELTETEYEILALVARGLKNKEVAQQFGIAVNTVKWHLQHIYAKLCIENRTKATLYWLEHNSVSDRGSK